MNASIDLLTIRTIYVCIFGLSQSYMYRNTSMYLGTKEALNTVVSEY